MAIKNSRIVIILSSIIVAVFVVLVLIPLALFDSGRLLTLSLEHNTSQDLSARFTIGEYQSGCGLQAGQGGYTEIFRIKPDPTNIKVNWLYSDGEQHEAIANFTQPMPDVPFRLVITIEKDNTLSYKYEKYR